MPTSTQHLKAPPRLRNYPPLTPVRSRARLGTPKIMPTLPQHLEAPPQLRNYPPLTPVRSRARFDRPKIMPTATAPSRAYLSLRNYPPVTPVKSRAGFSRLQRKSHNVHHQALRPISGLGGHRHRECLRNGNPNRAHFYKSGWKIARFSMLRSLSPEKLEEKAESVEKKVSCLKQLLRSASGMKRRYILSEIRRDKDTIKYIRRQQRLLLEPSPRMDRLAEAFKGRLTIALLMILMSGD